MIVPPLLARLEISITSRENPAGKWKPGSNSPGPSRKAQNWDLTIKNMDLTWFNHPKLGFDSWNEYDLTMKINHLKFGFNRQQLGLDHQQFLSNKAMEVHGSTFRLRAPTEMLDTRIPHVMASWMGRWWVMALRGTLTILYYFQTNPFNQSNWWFHKKEDIRMNNRYVANEYSLLAVCNMQSAKYTVFVGALVN